jgi:hypothetical protein
MTGAPSVVIIERMAEMLLGTDVKLWFFQLELTRHIFARYPRYSRADSNQNLDKFARFLTEPAKLVVRDQSLRPQCGELH